MRPRVRHKRIFSCVALPGSGKDKQMIYALLLLICFLASIIGSICGIGGGVIIKPVMDSIGLYDVKTISFLSGCTVLSMSAYTVVVSGITQKNSINFKIGTPLAIGAAVGGILGKAAFQSMISRYDQNSVGAVQAAALIIITAGTLLYTVFKSRIPTLRVKNLGACILIGALLGIMSSFLGIGGGPVNLIILYYFFSMPTQAAVRNSLYIILFSQISSLLHSIILKTIPSFSLGILILMSAGGILGGFFGHRINKKIKSKTVECLFISLMIVIIFMNILNLIKYS